MTEFMDRDHLLYSVEPMRLQDIPEVVEIERLSFPTPWPARAYRYEVRQNRLAHYFVARRHFPDEREERAEEKETGLLKRLQSCTQTTKAGALPVVGYCGFWIAADEAHISTIAVDPEYRRQGVGQLLLITAIERAIELGASLVSLEVRVSNLAAQNLYRKYGFNAAGRRPRYYSDNREDALIMSTEHLRSAPYQRLLEGHREQLLQRLKSRPVAVPQE
jgi:ribosomal-protein-alanine N-acetyltransferase